MKTQIADREALSALLAAIDTVAARIEQCTSYDDDFHVFVPLDDLRRILAACERIRHLRDA